MKNEALDRDSSFAAADAGHRLLGEARAKSDWRERINSHYWVNNLLRLHQEWFALQKKPAMAASSRDKAGNEK